ncbi:MAG: condensation domain-containing protein, partial [Ktedonobacteraceae bacterium]
MLTEDSFEKRQAELSAAKLALLEKRLHQDALASRENNNPRSAQETTPLSFAQQRLWFLQQLEPESAAYNEPIVVRLSGPLDVEAFTRMVREMTRRHAVLGSRFTQLDRKLVQVHDPQAHEHMPVPMTDLSGVPDDERAVAVQHAMQQALQRPFALAQDLPWRTSLLRLNEQEHISVTILHHTVTDAWSLSIFYREVGQLYRAFCQHQPSPLPVLPLQYADYAFWQRQRLADGTLEHHLDYWKHQLSAPLPVLDVPTDYPRPAMQTYRGNRVAVTIPTALTQQLHARCHQEGVTLFMALLAAFQILLYRYTQQEDVIVGTPIAGRTHQELEVLLGCFVNTLALRT